MKREKPRGSRFWRWAYARWVQVLAFFDLLGRDGRPSRTTLAGGLVLACGCYVLVATKDATAWLVLLIFGALLLLYNRHKFAKFAERVAARGEKPDAPEGG